MSKLLIFILILPASCGTIRRPDGYKAKAKCGELMDTTGYYEEQLEKLKQ